MTLDRKVQIWWAGEHARDILDWYAGLVHESHRLASPTDDWFKCPLAPCDHLQRAIREGKVPDEPN